MQTSVHKCPHVKENSFLVQSFLPGQNRKSDQLHKIPETSTNNSVKLLIYEKKFSPGPGFEPRSPALRAVAITTNLPKRSTGAS